MVTVSHMTPPIHCTTDGLGSPQCAQAFEDGMSEEQIFEYTSIDPWFLAQLGELHAAEQWLRTRSLADLGPEDFLQVKKRGFSDVQIARAVGAWPPSPPP